MGRELKRVPLDFDWPIGKTWEGYVNPLHVAIKCAACDGDGYSPEMRHLKNLWYGYEPFTPADRGSVPFTVESVPVRRFAERNIANAPDFYGSGERAIVREAQRLCKLWNGQWCHHLNEFDVAVLVIEGRLWDLTHTRDENRKIHPREPFVFPTPRQVNDWSISGFGHDSINFWCVAKAECNRLCVPHTCKICEGEGEIWPSPEAKAAYDNWKEIEPPVGDAYQIWETVSEGSPISPPFPTPEDLARHMATTKWGADDGTPYETWLAFIRGPGWAPSMIGIPGNLRSGVAGVVALEKQ
jgi:hypothetical protein